MILQLPVLVAYYQVILFKWAEYLMQHLIQLPTKSLKLSMAEGRIPSEKCPSQYDWQQSWLPAVIEPPLSSTGFLSLKSPAAQVTVGSPRHPGLRGKDRTKQLNKRCCAQRQTEKRPNSSTYRKLWPKLQGDIPEQREIRFSFWYLSFRRFHRLAFIILLPSVWKSAAAQCNLPQSLPESCSHSCDNIITPETKH